MERTISKLYYLMTCLILLSCSQDKDIAHWHYANSYVYEYVQYDNIILGVGTSGEINVNIVPTYSYGAFSKSAPDIDRYKAKCQLYNDNGYDLKFWTLIPDSYENTVQDRNFKAIKIYCDKDYSENYPAGTDLSPVFYIASRSPYKFIKSGYRIPCDTESLDYPEYYREYLNYRRGIDFTISSGIYPVFGLLSEVSEDDLKLLGFGHHWTSPFEIFTLYPCQHPDNNSVHKFTVEILDTDDRILSSCIEIDFSHNKGI